MVQSQLNLNDDKKKDSELIKGGSLNDVDKKKATDSVKKESFQAQLNLKDSIKKEELELKLKEATSLSEKQISEVADVILEKLTKIQKDIEEQNTKNDSKRDLEGLSQSVINSSNVDMKLRDNNWTIVWSMNVNKTTNNINITINQTEQKVVQMKPVETKPVQAKPVQVNPVEAKPTETKLVETKPVQASSVEVKPIETKLVETKFNTSVNSAPDVYTLVWFLSISDRLLQEIKETKDWISKKWLSKAWKKTMDDAKKKLWQYEKQLKWKIEGLKKMNKSKISDSDVDHLKFLWEGVNQVRKDIWLWQWGEFSSTASFLYNSPENAKEANKRQMNSIEFNQKLQEEVKKWAILNIFGWNVKAATDFYRRIAQWQYTQADYELFRTNGAILTPSFQSCGIAVPMWPIQTNLWWKEYTSWSSGIDYKNMTLWESFQSGWLAWVVDKALSNCKNMTPWQREMWKSLAVLWGFAAWIVWIYKFFTSKSLNKREKLWITAVTVLWSQIATWEWPISLYTKLMTWGFTKEYMQSKFWWGVFWDAVNWVWNSWIDAAQTIVPSMYFMMIFNDKTTVWDIRNLTTTFKTDRNAWIKFRQDSINKLKTGGYGNACIERFSATFSDNFDEEKWKEWLVSMWITDSTDAKKMVCELANNSAFNEVALTKFKSDNWLKETDVPVKKQEFKDYIKERKQRNQAINLSVLEAHKNDWFKVDDKLSYTERGEDKQNKEKLVNQVNLLSIDLEKKEQLKQAVQMFYDERTINNKPNLNDFSLRIEADSLVVKSHGWTETKINLNNNSIKWFWARNWNGYEIGFSSLSDLLNVADLTNDILSRQKWQTIVNFPPFQYKIARKWICFNDADTLSFNMDTRILSTGWGWATSKVGTLYEHPEEYAQYLSNRWIEDNKINLTSYPLTKKLSESWMVFFDEQEVRNMEVRLKWIKERLKVFKCYPKWNPFSIKVLSNSLRFKTINWKMEEFSWNILDMFPTLKYEGNEDRLLNMLNNPSNKMWWSAF